MAEQIKTRMTAAEFFALSETNLPTELLDGECIQRSAHPSQHQRLSLRLVIGLTQHIPNGEIFIAPLDVYFDDLNILQPDVMWVAEGSQCQILEKCLQGPPDLIVEILSSGSIASDRKSKFHLYQKYSVREYWIVDPVESLIEIWQWVSGKFQLVDIYSRDETLDSPLLGRIPASDIFGET